MSHGTEQANDSRVMNEEDTGIKPYTCFFKPARGSADCLCKCFPHIKEAIRCLPSGAEHVCVEIRMLRVDSSEPDRERERETACWKINRPN